MADGFADSAPRQGGWDLHEYVANRSRHSAALAVYAGKYLAWKPDGSDVIASDEDQFKLESQVRAAGYDPALVIVSYVPPADEAVLGAGGDLP